MNCQCLVQTPNYCFVRDISCISFRFHKDRVDSSDFSILFYVLGSSKIPPIFLPRFLIQQSDLKNLISTILACQPFGECGLYQLKRQQRIRSFSLFARRISSNIVKHLLIRLGIRQFILKYKVSHAIEPSA